ncbi:MAG: hypothetical protein ACRD0A_06465 [Acidimicrobiales bacterium]
MQTALAATAGLVAFGFALSTLERWVDHRRRYQLAWTVALFAFAVASAAQWAGAALGWNAVSFRIFYLFGPIVSVPVLALGTVYLLAGRRVGDRVGLVLLLVLPFAAGVLTVAPLTAAVDPDVFPQGSDVFGPLPRALAAVFSGVAAVVLVGGAVLSAVRLARRRTSRRLALANGLIAAGTLLLSAGGLLNSVADEMVSFAVMHAIGITVVFLGFLATTPAQPVGPNRSTRMLSAVTPNPISSSLAASAKPSDPQM